MNHADISMIMEMGFSRTDAIKALHLKNNEVDEALDYLLNAPLSPDLLGIQSPLSVPIEDQKGGIQMDNKGNLANKGAEVEAVRVEEEAVHYLMSMGFSRQQAIHGLEMNAGQLEHAADYLLNSQEAHEGYADGKEEKILENPQRKKIIKSLHRVADDNKGAIHFGDKVQFLLRYCCVISFESSSYDELRIIHKRENDLGVDNLDQFMEREELVDHSVFILLNPSDLGDISPIKNGNFVVVSQNDPAKGDTRFLAIEGDGSVNLTRTGPVELFMKWTIHRTDSRDLLSKFMKDSNLIYPNEDISLTSPLKFLLTHDPKTNSCVGLLSPDPFASNWKIRLMVDRPVESFFDLAINAGAAMVGSLSQHLNPVLSLGSQKAGGELWEYLRNNFRIAAIRLIKKQIRHAIEKREHDRNLILAANENNADKKECTMCWEKEPDTVLLECGHICLCSNCAPNAKDCPLCRKSIVRFIVIRK